MTSRRHVVLGGMAALMGAGLSESAMSAASQETFEIVKSDEQWRRQLSKEQYAVLREHGTERAGTSPLDKEYRPGTYLCAACDLPVFSADTKFDSGTGWPSFWAPIEGRSGPPRTAASCCWSAPRCIATAAAATSATCSMTARSRPGCAIA